MTIVRPADMERDALGIVEGLEDFKARVAFGHLLPDGDDFVAVVGRVVSLDSMEVFVAESGGEIVGLLGLLFAPFLWNPELLTAEELFWWTRRDAPVTTALRLFRAARRRVEERGATPVFRSLETSPARVTRIYERAGMTPVETVYMGGV